MIEANKNELFPITVSLLDDVTNELITNQTVTYDVRTIDDALLSPPVNGNLSESTVKGGIYKTQISLPASGTYVCYAFCTGFLAGTEEIIISNENIYEVVKNTHQYNISVEDIIRETTIPTASQAARNVPINATDYIISVIKDDTESDWSNATIGGTTWAWYTSMSGSLPYKMGPEF